MYRVYLGPVIVYCEWVDEVAALYKAVRRLAAQEAVRLQVSEENDFSWIGSMHQPIFAGDP